LVSAEEKKPFKSRFSLKLTAGFGSDLPIGDVNDCLEAFNNNYVFEAHRESETGQLVGEIKTLDTRILNGEAELRFELTRRISFGIATSLPIRKRNESSLTFTILGWAGPQVMTWTFRPEIRVFFPIRLSTYYMLPLNRRLRLSIGGGIGIYPAKISEFFRFDEIDPSGGVSWYTWDQQAKQDFGLGLHGNASFEFLLNKRLALVAEFQYRLCKISGFKGTLKHDSIYGNKYEKSGTLFYYTAWNYFLGIRLPTLEIWPDSPNDPYISIGDVRKASLNLSGYSIRIGIHIRLF
jgi:hypothetical protein